MQMSRQFEERGGILPSSGDHNSGVLPILEAVEQNVAARRALRPADLKHFTELRAGRFADECQGQMSAARIDQSAGSGQLQLRRCLRELKRYVGRGPNRKKKAHDLIRRAISA